MSSDSTDSEVTLSLQTERLRIARERRGLSQHELAKRCKLGANQISRYETGATDPSASALARIAYALDVSTDYLLGLSDLPQNMKMHDLPLEERKLLEAFMLGDSVAMLEIVTERLRDLRGEKSSEDE